MITPLEHLVRNYYDINVSRDMDCLYAACHTQAEAVVAKEYAKARRKGHGFAPGKEGANNHKHLPSAWNDLDILADQIASIEPDEREAALRRLIAASEAPHRCETCGAEFNPTRSSARYCSSGCRVRKSRDRV